MKNISLPEEDSVNIRNIFITIAASLLFYFLWYETTFFADHIFLCLTSYFIIGGLWAVSLPKMRETSLFFTLYFWPLALIYIIPLLLLVLFAYEY